MRKQDRAPRRRANTCAIVPCPAAAQGKQYDSNANFCRTWVPEVKSVPAPLVHNPQELPPHQRVRCVRARCLHP